MTGVSTGANFTLTNTAPSSSSSPQGYSPAQIRQAYGFGSDSFVNGTVAGDGTGQTIAIVVAYQQPNIVPDLQAFNTYYGLPQFNQPGNPTFTPVAVGGDSVPLAPPGYWGIEASLDVEWAHALAPGANIILVEAQSAGTDLFTAVDFARNQPGVSVISMSWGFSEFSGETNYWHRISRLPPH